MNKLPMASSSATLAGLLALHEVAAYPASGVVDAVAAAGKAGAALAESVRTVADGLNRMPLNAGDAERLDEELDRLEALAYAHVDATLAALRARLTYG